MYVYRSALYAYSVASVYHAEALREVLTQRRHGPREGTHRLLGWPPAGDADLDDLAGAQYLIDNVYAAMCGREPPQVRMDNIPEWAVLAWERMFKDRVKHCFGTVNDNQEAIDGNQRDDWSNVEWRAIAGRRTGPGAGQPRRV